MSSFVPLSQALTEHSVMSTEQPSMQWMIRTAQVYILSVQGCFQISRMLSYHVCMQVNLEETCSNLIQPFPGILIQTLSDFGTATGVWKHFVVVAEDNEMDLIPHRQSAHNHRLQGLSRLCVYSSAQTTYL